MEVVGKSSSPRYFSVLVAPPKEIPFTPDLTASMAARNARNTNIQYERSVAIPVRVSLLAVLMGLTPPIQLLNLRTPQFRDMPPDRPGFETFAPHRSPVDALRASFEQSVSHRPILETVGAVEHNSGNARTIHAAAPDDGVARSVSRLGWRCHVPEPPALRTQNIEAGGQMQPLLGIVASQVRASIALAGGAIEASPLETRDL